MRFRPWDWTIPNFRPREWQGEVQPLVWPAIEEGGAPLISVVMGGGKSISIGEVAAEAMHRYKCTVLVVTPKQRLVHELSETLEQRLGYVGQWYGRKKTQARCIVACHASLKTVPLLDRMFVIVDECHKTENDRFKEGVQRLRDGVGDLWFMGYTATPYGAGRKDTLSLFDRSIYNLPPGRALAMGIVVPWQIISNTVGIKDLDDAAISACQNAPYPCVTDAVSIEDAEKFAAELRDAGVTAGVVHSKMSFTAQDETIEQLKSGKINVLVQIDLLTEGVNIKEIQSLVLRRRRSSRTSFAQFIGRGLRVAPGKDRCLIYDLPGNFERLRLSYSAALGEGEAKEEPYVSPLDTSKPKGSAPPAPERKSKVISDLAAYLRQLSVGVYELGAERPNGDQWMREANVLKSQLKTIEELHPSVMSAQIPGSHKHAIDLLFKERAGCNRGDAADMISVFREVALYGWPKHLDLLATVPRKYEICI